MYAIRHITYSRSALLSDFTFYDDLVDALQARIDNGTKALYMVEDGKEAVKLSADRIKELEKKHEGDLAW